MPDTPSVVCSRDDAAEVPVTRDAADVTDEADDLCMACCVPPSVCG
jgi:hypothetical protein